eukprot:TRINITY_DN32848_c0_g4_i1.p1 TRINITY_DN32848_c0_g4~~TRINITY_DN32848_c0_g4_i1.p1  ORF type:complete len:859 (-),score=142.76 TRINITY_DN32848_c0_g4_i1:101-2677(-)
MSASLPEDVVLLLHPIHVPTASPSASEALPVGLDGITSQDVLVSKLKEVVEELPALNFDLLQWRTVLEGYEVAFRRWGGNDESDSPASACTATDSHHILVALPFSRLVKCVAPSSSPPLSLSTGVTCAGVLAICSASSKSAWLLLVFGKDAEEGHLLSQVADDFSRFGAVRYDFNDSYSQQKILGNGASAEVFKVRRLLDGGEFAAKIWTKSVSTAGFKLEVQFLLCSTQEGAHPNLVSLIGMFRQPRVESGSSPWILVMSLHSGGDLYDIVSRVQHAAGGLFEEGHYEVTRHIMLGVMSALDRIHSCGIVHRDVKSENIITDFVPSAPPAKQYRAVLTDFGIAAFVDDAERMKQSSGSPGYAAPEIILEKPYGLKVDIFSAGVVHYFLLAGSLPFQGKSVAAVLRRTIRGTADLTIPQLEKVRPRVKKLLGMMLSRDAEMRPTGKEALDMVEEYLNDKSEAMPPAPPRPPSAPKPATGLRSQLLDVSSQKPGLSISSFDSTAVDSDGPGKDSPAGSKTSLPRVETPKAQGSPVNGDGTPYPQGPAPPAWRRRPTMCLARGARQRLSSAHSDISDGAIASLPAPARGCEADILHGPAPHEFKAGNRTDRRRYYFHELRGGGSDVHSDVESQSGEGPPRAQAQELADRLIQSEDEEGLRSRGRSFRERLGLLAGSAAGGRGNSVRSWLSWGSRTSRASSVASRGTGFVPSAPQTPREGAPRPRASSRCSETRRFESHGSRDLDILSDPGIVDGEVKARHQDPTETQVDSSGENLMSLDSDTLHRPPAASSSPSSAVTTGGGYDDGGLKTGLMGGRNFLAASQGPPAGGGRPVSLTATALLFHDEKNKKGGHRGRSKAMR